MTAPMVAPERTPFRRAVAWGLDPVRFAVDSGLPTPDETQERVLRDESPSICITASRQWGKSSIVSRIALRTGALSPDSLTLIGSIGERQAGEMLRKCRDGLTALARLGCAPVVTRESLSLLEFGNGARVVSLPGDERAWRSWSAPDLVIIDESAQVRDEVFSAARPLLSHGGRMILLSSAWAEVGFHWSVATGSDASWTRYTIPASQCPRFSAAWLASERAALGPRKFAREYECRWGSTSDQLFTRERVMAMLDDTVVPLFPALHAGVAA